MRNNLLKFFRRVSRQLQIYLPGKKVYFLYTHNNCHDRFQNGLKANTEISYWCARALEKAFPHVVFLHFAREKQQRIQRITSQDVVIGHIGDTFVAASERTKRLISFNPWNGHLDHSEGQSPACMPKEQEMGYYDRAASLILLTSEFNKQKYLEQPTNFWYDYMCKRQQAGSRVRVVHQPIDFSLFPRIKTSYTTHQFLYIGNTNHMKGVPAAQKLVREVGSVLHLYGTGERNLNHLDHVAVNQLPQQADFFIQPGMWEAQCVSILESAARGFIPLVTPDTGYPYDHPYLLRYGDHAYNLKQVQGILTLPSHERKALGDSLHQRLTQDVCHNNWEQLTNVIVEEVFQLYK